jgi:hypothetical protein
MFRVKESSLLTMEINLFDVIKILLGAFIGHHLRNSNIERGRSSMLKE